MNLLSLVAYAIVSLGMVLSCLLGKKGRIYEFPFWMGTLGMTYFFPLAYYAVSNEQFVGNIYSSGMWFATLCMIAVWAGFKQSYSREVAGQSWLDASFNFEKLVTAGIVLSVAGFFFQLKLQSLPEEMLAQTQWSGATVKYLFLASVFKIGFLTLWLAYLRQKKRIIPKILIFMIPGLLLLLNTAVVQGRRAAMMDLAAYILIGLWFARRVAFSRIILIVGLAIGLVLLSAIGTYRSIMNNDEVSLSERLKELSHADLVGDSKKNAKDTGYDFNNYIYYRRVLADEGKFNFGVSHWNGFVHGFIPAQLVGKTLKEALKIQFSAVKYIPIAEQRYGHKFRTGTVSTGYLGAFGSFGWFGFIKFYLIGWIMGILYRHAMNGSFLAQLLYIYVLTAGMHAISHGTQQILVNKWVYFLALGYPALYWARCEACPEGGQLNPSEISEREVQA